jgi:RecA/RadA recombinase
MNKHPRSKQEHEVQNRTQQQTSHEQQQFNKIQQFNSKQAMNSNNSTRTQIGNPNLQSKPVAMCKTVIDGYEWF